jgi:ATP:corrinoid adenosyltransferase
MLNHTQRGYLHLYTGNGKGKTTSSVGLTLRAVAAGWRVYYAQFIKNRHSGEICMLSERFPEVKLALFGGGFFLRRAPEDRDIALAHEGLLALESAVSSGKYGMVVADEILIALKYGLIPEARVLELADAAQGRVELVLTGRYASSGLMDRADLVSEIHPRKHYMEQGVSARKGVEL